MQNVDDRRRLYEHCVRDQAASMYRLAYRLTGSADLAEELVQTTFYCAWRSLHQLKDHSKMGGWMFSILRNQHAKLRRKRRGERELTDAMIDNLASNPHDSDGDTGEAIQNAIQRLDDNHKLPLLLVAMEEYSIEAAAEALGWPRGTVLSRLHRGRQKLKSLLLGGHAPPIDHRKRRPVDHSPPEMTNPIAEKDTTP